MTIRKRKNSIAILLILAFMLTFFVSILQSSASAVTQDDIDALKEKKKQATANYNAQKSVVDELNAQQDDLIELKLAIEQNVAYIQEQISLNQQEIDMYVQMIADKEAELQEAIELEAQQLARYRARVRAMEENGSIGILGILLQCSSFTDLLTAIEDINDIMTADRKLEDEYIAARENTQRVKAEYEATKAELDVKAAELNAEQEELNASLSDANAQIAEIVLKINEQEAELDRLEELMEKASDDVTKMIAQYEKEKKAAQGGSGGGGGGGGTATGTGSFSWPTPSCTYITSRYGDRIHPIYGTTRFHSGLDIGAGYGATILAADGGTVITCGVVGGYGNCVMIDHGNGYISLYGHMSSFATSSGAVVGKGDTIGYVGSTGDSTGPHLHFEIRYSSGGTTDPAQFFSGLTYAPDA